MRARVLIAVVGVVAAALLPAIGVLLQLASSSDWYRQRTDQVSTIERRYAPLRETLRGETVVGYLVPAQADSAAVQAHLYVTRYALAPVRVVESIDQSLVVADGTTDRGVPPHFTVRHDFGGGLLLLERSPQ